MLLLLALLLGGKTPREEKERETRVATTNPQAQCHLHLPRSCRTPTASARRDEDTAGILRVAACHCYHLACIGIRLDLDEKVKHPRMRGVSLLKAFKGPKSRSSASLGLLSRLPPELLAGVLLGLDLLSVVRFRWVNNLARHVAAASPHYRAVAAHAPAALRALFRTGAAARATLRDLHGLVVSDSGACSFCGLLGTLLFIPALSRCYFTCLTTSPELAVVTAARVPRRRPREALLAVHTVPGSYALLLRRRTRRQHLVSCAAVLDAFGVSCTERPNEGTGVLRCVVVVDLPHIDRASRQVTRRYLSCQGCQMAVRRSRGARLDLCRIGKRPYTANGLLEHFDSCADAQALWKASTAAASR
ncbi:hypothetical protein RB595_001679 [Gaeumannomyces hyphopodioides]